MMQIMPATGAYFGLSKNDLYDAKTNIDFGAMSEVDDAKLEELLDHRSTIRLDEAELGNLKAGLENAKRMLYITDNAGEVVLDKIFIRVLKQLYPDLEIAVLVRGFPTLNDAVREDVESIGMAEYAKILENGKTAILSTSETNTAMIQAALKAGFVIKENPT